MAKTLHFKRSEMKFRHYAGPPGRSELAGVVGPGQSQTLGAGIATFDDSSIEWTVRYDEVICALKGRFRLVVGGERFECEPGDVLWIPKGTALKYESDGPAEVFYALYPVDWE